MEKMLIFPLKYVFDVDKTVSFATREVSFEGQNKQIQQLSTNPMKSWNITVRGTPQERTILESFFEKVGGNTRPFVFMDERNRPRWCRFADSKLNITEKRAWTNEFNPQGDVVGFEAKIVIELAQSEADENADTAEAEALWAKRFKGEDGATFIPHISPTGLLTWTNNKGLPNPKPRQTVAIKGDQGITFRPSVDPKTANLSWTNDGGLQNPATVNVRGFTFTPSVSSDGTISWSNNGNLTNPRNVNVRGATFTPSVSSDGVLSWTNDKGKDNPTPMHIRGPKGERGLKGDKGDPGTTDYRQLVNRPSLVSLERNTRYEVGDIVYSKKLPAGWYLECVTAGTTGSTEPDLKRAVSTGGGLSDGSCRFSVKQEMSLLTGITKATNLNSAINGTSGFQILSTGTDTLNLPTDLPWMYIMQLNGPTNISQLAFPMYLNGGHRLRFRAQAGLNSTTPITTSWREIPYADETPLLQDNDNNTKKIVVDRFEGTADSSKRTAPIINIGSYRNKTVKELKDKLKEIIRTSNNGHSFIVEANNVDRDFLANNWFDDAAILTGGAGYVTFHISDVSGGSTALTTFRTPSSKYEVFLEAGNWLKVDKWATQDFVQEAIEEAFKKRNL